MASPLFSEYAPERCTEHGQGCPGAAGGEHITVCWWCKRPVRDEDDEALRVMVGFSTEWMCGRCYEKSDPEVPLDYTTERDDHEGDPAWNGAFG